MVKVIEVIEALHTKEVADESPSDNKLDKFSKTTLFQPPGGKRGGE